MATWKRHAGAVLLTGAATALVTGIGAGAAVAAALGAMSAISLVLYLLFRRSGWL